MSANAEQSLDAVQLAAQAHFNRQSGNYGGNHILADVADVREALSHLELPAKARVLDVATGGGHTGLFFAELGHDVTLADISPAMLKEAGEAAAKRGLTVVTSEQPAEDFLQPNEVFDLVTCRVAAHHFSSPDKFVRESARVLKPGGWFLLIDGTVVDGEPVAEAWAHQVEKLRDPSHARFLTPRRWCELCESAGMKLTRHRVWLKKQPDLNWYFEAADTPSDNRKEVMALIANAPESARRLFSIGVEEGRTIWWWHMITLIAQKQPKKDAPQLH